MRRVLVAPLGTSPIVVSAMAHALEHHPEGPHRQIEVIELLYPYSLDFGADLLEDVLRNRYTLRRRPLEFPDADTEERSLAYLRALDEILQEHAKDEVYVSLAGGRKSMAALTAVITQFHPQVQGLYHLLDRHEDDRRHFLSQEALLNLPEDQRRAAMFPPLEDVLLVEVPFHPLAHAADLRRLLARGLTEESLAIPLTDEGSAFFARLFGPKQPRQQLDLHLTQPAYEQFCALDATARERFWNCFRRMREPALLREKAHGTFSDQERTYHFYKAGRTAERPFFYTEPHDISGWPTQPVERVVVVGLSRHISEERYDFSGEEWLRRGQFAARYRLEDLPQRPGILVAPLGESPMVATQTAMLLQERERVRIERLVLIFPGKDPRVQNGVRLLQDLCRDAKLAQSRGGMVLEVEPVPVPGIADVASRADGEQFAQKLGSTLSDLQEQHPGHPIYLSLAGGRKTMAALAYFGAQQAGLERVWHTTICEPQFAEQVERETTLDQLEHLPRAERAARLFLQRYANQRGLFTLFPIPIVPIRA